MKFYIEYKDKLNNVSISIILNTSKHHYSLHIKQLTDKVEYFSFVDWRVWEVTFDMAVDCIVERYLSSEVVWCSEVVGCCMIVEWWSSVVSGWLCCFVVESVLRCGSVVVYWSPSVLGCSSTVCFLVGVAGNSAVEGCLVAIVVVIGNVVEEGSWGWVVRNIIVEGRCVVVTWSSEVVDCVVSCSSVVDCFSVVGCSGVDCTDVVGSYSSD